MVSGQLQLRMYRDQDYASLAPLLIERHILVLRWTPALYDVTSTSPHTIVPKFVPYSTDNKLICLKTMTYFIDKY